jgi:hypothetical protein
VVAELACPWCGNRISACCAATVLSAEPQAVSASPQRKAASSVAGVSSKSSKSRNRTTYTEDFDQFWKVYPRKKDKGTAATAYAKAIAEGVAVATLLAGAERYRDDPQRPTDERYVKYPATWLNAQAWLDEPGVPKPQAPKTPPDRIVGTPEYEARVATEERRAMMGVAR